LFYGAKSGFKWRFKISVLRQNYQLFLESISKTSLKEDVKAQKCLYVFETVQKTARAVTL